MPNYFIKNSYRNDRAVVVFHITIPDENNKAVPTAVNLRTAYKNMYNPASTLTIDHPGVSQRVLDDVSNGIVAEIEETVVFNAKASNTVKRNVIINRWSILNSMIPNRIRNRLRFWGTYGTAV